LAHHEGAVIEYYGISDAKWFPSDVEGPYWMPTNAYRIKPSKPEPKVETVTMTGGLHPHRVFWCFGADHLENYDTHLITFNLIDGKPDCDSVKMMPINE
jgi:hypothetical protein